MHDFINNIVVKRNKKINDVILVQIKEIAEANGIDVEINLDDDQIVEALNQYIENNKLLPSSVKAIDDMGRIQIPKKMRAQMGISDGDLIHIFYNNNELRLRKCTQL